jgi:hypothetical protein
MTDAPRETLWITDAELIRRIGAPEKIARDALRALDHNPRSGFPQKQKLWGDRRYWPAVKAYFDRTNGILGIGAARVAPERPDRDGLPRRSLPAAPMRRATHG